MTAHNLLRMFAIAGVIAIVVPGFGANDPSGMLIPRDRRVQSLLEQAHRELVDPDADHREALKTLQRIIDEAADVFVDSRMQLSLQQQASRILASLPDRTRQLYEETFGAEAASLLQAAEDQGVRPVCPTVVRRFFHTAAGAEAAYRLAAEDMDSGRLLAAARLFDRLRTEHAAAGRYEPHLTAGCLVCYWRAGSEDQAARVLSEAVQERPDLMVAGQRVPALASRKTAREWLATHLGTNADPSTWTAEHWLIPQGSRRRNPSSDPVSPLFDDSWSVPLIRDHDAADPIQVEELATLLDGVATSARNADWTTIPVLTPLVVGELVVFPSYGLVKAVNRNSGELQWAAVPADQTYRDSLRSSVHSGSQQLASEMNGFLAQRAWLDATSSQISSDGDRVYFVRDSGMVGGLSQQLVSPTQLNHPRSSKSFNSLRAYDAIGGNWLWEIGGARTRVSLPLAGSFFLGPPLPVDGTLYVLGEDLGQVRLHALSPETGDVRWSLPLVNADSDIEDNVDRRLAGLSPTFAGGLLICPTGGGLIVAVDSVTRSLAWGYRYRDPQNFLTPRRMRVRGPFMGLQAPIAQVVSVKALMEAPRWHDGCVVAVGGSILVAPPDVADPDHERRLLCLSLQDGRRLWQRERQGGLYVGGVYEQTVLLVGERQVEGVRLSNGRTLWTIPLARPSGRGVRCGPLYHLPLATGEIATIDMAQGTLLARAPVRSGRTLGNLVAVGGRLISQTATEVRSFRPRSEVSEQLARDLTADPDNVAALAVRGEFQLHDGETELGLADLRQVVAASRDQRSRQLLISTLLEGLRADFARYRTHVEELDRLAIDPDDRSRFLATYAQGLLDANEPSGAFGQYVRLLAETDGEIPLAYVADGRRVRRDRHVQGQLARLYAAAADDDARTELDRLIGEQLVALPAGPQADLRARLMTALPHLRGSASGAPGRSSTVDESELPTKAEARLLAERRGGDAQGRAAVSAKLVELYARQSRTEQVVQLLDELETVWAESPCLDGLTGAEWAAAARERDDVAAVLSGALTWPTEEITVRERDEQAILYAPLRSEGPTDPLTSTFLYLAENRGQIAIQDGHGRLIEHGVLRMLPAGGASSLQPHYVMQRGHRAVLFLGTQFKLIDLIDGQPRVLLEELLVDVQPTTNSRFPMMQRGATLQMGFRGRVRWSENPGENGSVGPLNDSVFCYLRGTTLQAHDPFTGERYWTVEDAPDGAEIFADSDFVLLVPIRQNVVPGQNVVHIYRALDGEKVGVRNLPRDVQRDRRGADWGRLFLRRSAAAGGGTAIAMYDPVSGKNVWERLLPKQFAWSPLDGSELCVVDTDGRMTLIEADTGRVLQEADVDVPQGMTSMSVLSLPDQWLLITSRRPAADARAQLAPIRMTETAYQAVNGPVTAFQRHTGNPLWSRIIASQYISPRLPARWPVLSLSAVVDAMPQIDGQRAIPVRTRHIQILDKRTGETIHETTTDVGNQQLGTFWQISDTEPQLRLRYGKKELEISFRETAAESIDEPSDRPPPPREPTQPSVDAEPESRYCWP